MNLIKTHTNIDHNFIRFNFTYPWDNTFSIWSLATIGQVTNTNISSTKCLDVSFSRVDHSVIIIIIILINRTQRIIIRFCLFIPIASVPLDPCLLDRHKYNIKSNAIATRRRDPTLRGEEMCVNIVIEEWIILMIPIPSTLINYNPLLLSGLQLNISSRLCHYQVQYYQLLYRKDNPRPREYLKNQLAKLLASILFWCEYEWKYS